MEVAKYEYDLSFKVGDKWLGYKGDVLSISVVKTDDGSDSCEVALYNPEGVYSPEGDDSLWRHVIVPNRRVRVGVYESGKKLLSFLGLVNRVELQSSDRSIRIALSSMYKLADKSIVFNGMSTIMYRNSLDSINTGLPQGHPSNKVKWYMEDIFVDLALRCGFSMDKIEIEYLDVNKSNICFEHVEFSGTYADAFEEIREITGMEISVDGMGVIRMVRSSEGGPNIVNRKVNVASGVGDLGVERLVLDSVVVLDSKGNYIGKDKYDIYLSGGRNKIRLKVDVGVVYVSFTYVKHVFRSGQDIIDLSMSYDDSPVYTHGVVRGEKVVFEFDESGMAHENREVVEGRDVLDNPYAGVIVRIGEMEPKVIEVNDRRLGTAQQCKMLAERKLKDGMRGLRTVSLESLIVEDIDVGDVVQIIEDVVGINEAYRVDYISYDISPGGYRMSLDVEHYGETLIKE